MNRRSPYNLFVKSVRAALVIAVGATLAAPVGASAVPVAMEPAPVEAKLAPAEVEFVGDGVTSPNGAASSTWTASTSTRVIGTERPLYLGMSLGEVACVAELGEEVPLFDCWGEIAHFAAAVGACALSIFPVFKAYKVIKPIARQIRAFKQKMARDPKKVPSLDDIQNMVHDAAMALFCVDVVVSGAILITCLVDYFTAEDADVYSMYSTEPRSLLDDMAAELNATADGWPYEFPVPEEIVIPQ